MIAEIKSKKSNNYLSLKLVMRMLLWVILLTECSYFEAFSNSHVQHLGKHSIVTPEDIKGKFKLIKPGSDDFSSFMVPPNGSLSHYAHVEYEGVDKIIKVIQTSPTKSIVIGKEDEKLYFAEMDIPANTLVTKSTFNIGDKEIIDLVLVRSGKLYIYSSQNYRRLYSLTVIEREFDANTFSHTKSRILLSATKKEDLIISDLLKENPSKIIQPVPEVFVCKNIEIKHSYDYTMPSEDSSRVLVSYIVGDHDKGRHLFICEHVLATDAVNIYSFLASPEIWSNYPSVTSIGSTIVIEKQFTTIRDEYLSNRTYFISEGKLDSIDYNFASFIKGIEDPDEVTFDIDSKSLVSKGETVEVLYNIRRKHRKTIGIAKVELDFKQRKAVSLNFIPFDESFRKKYKIEDEVDGYITGATSYTPNGDLAICIEKIYDLKTSKDIKAGTTCTYFYMFCIQKDSTIKWVYSNQERKVHSQEFRYLNNYSTAEYTKDAIFITTIEDEKEKGLWIHQLDPATGKIIKSEMPIDFSGTIAFSTNCLKNYSGKYYIVQPEDSPRELQIFTKK